MGLLREDRYGHATTCQSGQSSSSSEAWGLLQMGEVTPPSKGRTPSAPPALGPKGGTPHTASALERPGWLGGTDCSAINTAQDNR